MRVPEGKTFIAGMREVACGDASTLFDCLKGVVNAIGSLGVKDLTSWVNEKIVSIKNTMSDRAAVQKKMNAMLEDVSTHVAPTVKDEWSEMKEDERKGFCRMNNLFCGMHGIVSMAEQAQCTLKMWEHMIFGDTAVGAACHPGAKLCGTVRLVRTVCKAVQDRGCERAGKPVAFREFLCTVYGIHEVLPPFKGNRFNILFHNGAAVYALLADFLEQMRGDNLLMAAVHDLQVKQYVCGVGALGLICKAVTVPLWRVLESEGHVGKLTGRYECLLARRKSWAEDASDFLDRSERLFDDVLDDNDWVMARLTERCDLDPMTEQVLEVLFSSFVAKLRDLLGDQLEGGTNSNMDESMLSETVSVPKTNVACEWDFGLLDNLMRSRPTAHVSALEGVMMYGENGISDWLKNMDEDRIEKRVEAAPKSVEEQLLCEKRRREVLHVRRAEVLQMNQRQHERKEVNARLRAEELTGQLHACGGLMVREEEVDCLIRKMSPRDAQRVLEIQLKFRKFVLKCENVDGCLNVTKSRRKLNVQELAEYLKNCLRRRERELNVVNSATNMNELCADEDVVCEWKKKCLNEEVSQEDIVVCKRRNNEANVPFVCDLYDLVGKRVEHLNDRGVWRTAVVIRVCENGNEVLHEVVYDGCEPCMVDLRGDWNAGAIRECKLDESAVKGKCVLMRHVDDNGNARWWHGRVVNVVNGSGGSAEMWIEWDEADEEDLYKCDLNAMYVSVDLCLLE